MQRQVRRDDVPALYRGLLRSGLKERASAAGGDTNALRSRLAALSNEAERLAALVELAQDECGGAGITRRRVGGCGSTAEGARAGLADGGRTRNRLSGRVGTKLPTTLAFDYPTAHAIARLLLRSELDGKLRCWRESKFASSGQRGG